MKVYDCFMYWDEDLILDLRFNILDKYVDKFVVVESNKTWQNNPKDLKFDINKYKNFKDKIIITQDFGDQRFDKVFNKYDINSLIECAIESLIIINNSTINSISTNQLSKYNYDTFKNEISEFIEFFIPFKKIKVCMYDKSVKIL